MLEALRPIRPRVACAVALLSCCLWPDLAKADEPVRVTVYDPGAYPPPSTRWGLLALGVGSSMAWYGGGLACSYLWPDAPGANDLRVPVAGPWMALADTGCADGDPDCSTFMVVTRAILTTMNGLGQLGGLVITGEALFLPTASAGAPRQRSSTATSTLRLRPMPIVTPHGGAGLGVLGQF